MPDFPAEIRAPAGTLAGVSAFQVHISDHDILTAGDSPSVLVAMNPAALRANLADVTRGGTLILNVDAFDERALDKAGYKQNPHHGRQLERIHRLRGAHDIAHLARGQRSRCQTREAERAKNFFALGVVSWLFSRPIEGTLEWIAKRFSSSASVLDVNTRAFKAGYHFGETAELFESAYQVRPRSARARHLHRRDRQHRTRLGSYRRGTDRGLPLFLGSYPITPASDILHELSKHKHFGVRTLQAEDEIAGVSAAIGAAFGGASGSPLRAARAST